MFTKDIYVACWKQHDEVVARLTFTTRSVPLCWLFLDGLAGTVSRAFLLQPEAASTSRSWLIYASAGLFLHCCSTGMLKRPSSQPEEWIIKTGFRRFPARFSSKSYNGTFSMQWKMPVLNHSEIEPLSFLCAVLCTILVDLSYARTSCFRAREAFIRSSCATRKTFPIHNA